MVLFVEGTAPRRAGDRFRASVVPPAELAERARGCALVDGAGVRAFLCRRRRARAEDPQTREYLYDPAIHEVLS